jgi:hypothetical protein
MVPIRSAGIGVRMEMAERIPRWSLGQRPAEEGVR